MSTKRAAELNRLRQAVEQSGKHPKVQLSQSTEISNVVIVKGEVPSREAYDELIELARQHGFIALADNLSIPA